MESVYFYDGDMGRRINKILLRDFKNIPYIIEECELLGSERRGYFLYIRSRSEPTYRVERLLEEFGIMQLLGEEKRAVCRAIVTDEIELGAMGFRTMFKDGRPIEGHWVSHH